MTNGDKIRQMTDEQMLEYFCGLFLGDPNEAYTISIIIPHITQNGNMQMITEQSIRVLDWLKQEADG